MHLKPALILLTTVAFIKVFLRLQNFYQKKIIVPATPSQLLVMVKWLF
jgi:hypothetical protein